MENPVNPEQTPGGEREPESVEDVLNQVLEDARKESEKQPVNEPGQAAGKGPEPSKSGVQEPPAPEKKQEAAMPGEPKKEPEPSNVAPEPPKAGDDKGTDAAFARLRRANQELKNELKELKSAKQKIPAAVVPEISTLPEEYERLYQKHRELDPDSAELKKEEWLIMLKREAKEKEQDDKKGYNKSIEEMQSKIYQKIQSDIPEVNDPNSIVYQEAARILGPNPGAATFEEQVEAIETAQRIAIRAEELKQAEARRQGEMKHLKKVFGTEPPAMTNIEPVQPKKDLSIDDVLKLELEAAGITRS